MYLVHYKVKKIWFSLCFFTVTAIVVCVPLRQLTCRWTCLSPVRLKHNQELFDGMRRVTLTSDRMLVANDALFGISDPKLSYKSCRKCPLSSAAAAAWTTTPAVRSVTKRKKVFLQTRETSASGMFLLIRFTHS